MIRYRHNWWNMQRIITAMSSHMHITLQLTSLYVDWYEYVVLLWDILFSGWIIVASCDTSCVFLSYYQFSRQVAQTQQVVLQFESQGVIGLCPTRHYKWGRSCGGPSSILLTIECLLDLLQRNKPACLQPRNERQYGHQLAHNYRIWVPNRTICGERISIPNFHESWYL